MLPIRQVSGMQRICRRQSRAGVRPWFEMSISHLAHILITKVIQRYILKVAEVVAYRVGEARGMKRRAL
jgi:hypothetical protein